MFKVYTFSFSLLTEANVGSSADCAGAHDDCKRVDEVGDVHLGLITIYHKLIFTGIGVVILQTDIHLDD